MTRIGPARRRGPAVPVPFGTAPVGFGRSLGLAAITRAAFEGISPENLGAAGSGRPGARRRRGGTAGGTTTGECPVGTRTRKAEARRSFNTATVREQHPGSHRKGATSMQSHPAVRAEFEPATDGVRFYLTRHP